MILFTILAITCIIAMVIGVIILATGGAAFIVVFADVIVCLIFIGLIIKSLFKRKKKK